MRELVGRLEALDPDAGAALRVVTYFDQLVERRAGLENVVRGAAVLSGRPAVLVDADRGLRIRVEPDGIRRDIARPLEPEWCQLTVDAVTVCLEHPAPAGPVEAVVLERAVMAARTVLDRTRSRTKRPQRRDDELLEVLLDATAPDRDRTRAAQILGFALDGRVRVVAAVDGRLDVEAVPETAEERTAPPGNAAARAGVGPAAAPLDLPWTVEQARAAARFTAEGTATDPGPRVVHAEDLGGLLLLAQAVDGHPESIPDLLAIEKAATAAPWSSRRWTSWRGRRACARRPRHCTCTIRRCRTGWARRSDCSAGRCGTCRGSYGSTSRWCCGGSTAAGRLGDQAPRSGQGGVTRSSEGTAAATRESRPWGRQPALPAAPTAPATRRWAATARCTSSCRRSAFSAMAATEPIPAAVTT
jgi:hypothetical protein